MFIRGESVNLNLRCLAIHVFSLRFNDSRKSVERYERLYIICIVPVKTEKLIHRSHVAVVEVKEIN